VDILIMALLFAIALLIWRGAKRGVILALWFVGLVAMVNRFSGCTFTPGRSSPSRS